MPAFTPGRARSGARRAIAARFGDGPFDAHRGLHALRPLHHARRRRLDPAGRLRQRQPHRRRRRAMVTISYEMIHDTRVIYTDGRPHVGPSIRQYLGDCARPLGRRHARGRNDELHRPDEHRRRQRQRPAPQRRDEASPSASRGSTRRRSMLSVTVDDPKTYVKPFTMLLDLTTGGARTRCCRTSARGSYAEEHAQRGAR